jgi:hypothetical protein
LLRKYTMSCECSTTDVLNFVIDVNGTQKAKVLVTVKSECQETSDGCQVTYTVTNDASADTNVSALSVAGDTYIFDVTTANEVLPGQVGTVTVTRPGAECKVTSEGTLSVEFPSLGLGGVEYKGICVCTLAKACDQSDTD